MIDEYARRSYCAVNMNIRHVFTGTFQCLTHYQPTRIGENIDFDCLKNPFLANKKKRKDLIDEPSYRDLPVSLAS